MDQHSSKNEAAHFKLPEVHPEPKPTEPLYEVDSNNIAEHSMARAVEQNTVAKPMSSPPVQATVPVAVDPMPINDPSTMVNAGATTSPKKIIVTDNLPARDVELIEKAWVIKAKQIVDQTKNDPYEQSDELNKIRNDYQSKRFHTNIKLDKE